MRNSFYIIEQFVHHHEYAYLTNEPLRALTRDPLDFGKLGPCSSVWVTSPRLTRNIVPVGVECESFGVVKLAPVLDAVPGVGRAGSVSNP